MSGPTSSACSARSSSASRATPCRYRSRSAPRTISREWWTWSR
ncbi:Uncharacterised protein [Bordetella pertussis]|nr:Uncharacterised protein [Bordetella pertussis]